MNKSFKIALFTGLLGLLLVFGFYRLQSAPSMSSMAKPIKIRASDFDPRLFMSEEKALFQLLGLTLDDLEVVIDSSKLMNGDRLTRYRQIVNGHRVYGSRLTVITDEHGLFVRLGGPRVDISNSDKMKPATLSPEDSISAAIRHIYSSKITESSFPEKPESEAVVYLNFFDQLRYGYVVTLMGYRGYDPKPKPLARTRLEEKIEVVIEGEKKLLPVLILGGDPKTVHTSIPANAKGQIVPIPKEGEKLYVYIVDLGGVPDPDIKPIPPEVNGDMFYVLVDGISGMVVFVDDRVKIN